MAERTESTRLVLVRHGEADCNVAKRFGGPLGCTGLSPNGREQVERLRDRLRRSGELADTTALYASTLPRAIETAQILNDAIGHPELVTDERVCELHPGEADNMSFVDYSSTFFAEGSGRWRDDPSIPTAPGGESWTGFLDRVEAALIDLTDRHAGGTVVVACHGGVVDASFRALGGLAIQHRLNTDVDNAAVTEWVGGGASWRLARYNDAAHRIGVDA